MNQELMILLVSVNEATKTPRQSLCINAGITKCKHVFCCDCMLNATPKGYSVDLTNTARELAYEPRTNSNTQFPV